MIHEELVKRVMEKMLRGNDPILETLRCQYNSAAICSVENSSAGFFVNFQSTSSKIDSSKFFTKFQLGDVYGNVGFQELAVGFILYVKDGEIVMLEGYTLMIDIWPDDNTIDLCYDSGDQRDFSALRQTWLRKL